MSETDPSLPPPPDVSAKPPAARSAKGDVIMACLAGFFLIVSVFAMSPYAQVFLCLYGSLFAYGPHRSANPTLRRVGTVLLIACLSMAIAWIILSRLAYGFGMSGL